MELEQAREIIAAWVAAQFGKTVELRDVAVVRRASGRAWQGELYCVIGEDELKAGSLEISENGQLLGLTPPELVEQLVDYGRRLAAQEAEESAAAAPAPAATETDFSDLGGEDGFSSMSLEDDFSDLADDEDLRGRESVYDAVDPSVVQELVATLIATGERDKLIEARHLLPQLLTRHEGRGDVLRQMGELELLLGELDLGLNYLEAAAREFADVADIESLGHVAEITLHIVGEEQFEANTIKSLLDRSRARLRPVEHLNHAPVFIGLTAEQLFDLEGASHEISIPKGEDLLIEGEPAVRAFVVRSGILSIRLADGEGGQRIVRSCFPGDFIGESSVLGEPGATCTATVRAEVLTTLWQFDGNELRQLGVEHPDILARIGSAQTLHRLDSFMSMHEATAALDVAVRDQLLGCINGIRRVPAEEVLSEAGGVPTGVYLIADGKVEYRVDGSPPRTYEVDSFAGLRDTLHELELEGDFVTVTECLLVSFDPEQLKSIARAAPPEVVAVLERLE